LDCGVRWRQSVGGGFLFHLLHCDRCGAERRIRFDEIEDENLRRRKGLAGRWKVATAEADADADIKRSSPGGLSVTRRTTGSSRTASACVHAPADSASMLLLVVHDAVRPQRSPIQRAECWTMTDRGFMDEIEIRRANVLDSSEAVFDAQPLVAATANVAGEVEELVDLAGELPRRGVGRSLVLLRGAARDCRAAATRVETTADELSSLLGDFVAHAGRPDAVAASIHGRFERARARHDKAFDDVLVFGVRAARLAAGLASLHGPNEGEDPLWDHALDLLTRLALPPLDVDATAIPDDPTLDVLLTGLAAHVGQHARAFAVVQVEGTDNRFVQFLVTEDGEAEVESVGDGMLRRAERLRRADLAFLTECGLSPPGEGRPNWHIHLAVVSASRIGTLSAEILRQVHRVSPPTRLLISLGEDHGDQVTSLLPGATAPELAASLAQRIHDELGDEPVDAWVTVAPFGDGAGWSGHLRSRKENRLEAC
jgi:hypothetical protein